MRLDSFFLADAASTPGDGKFYIHGGGLSRFVVPMLPFPLTVAVFIRLQVDEAEVAAPHGFQVAVIGPTGQPNVPPLDIQSTPGTEVQPLLEGEQRYAQIALNVTLGIIRTGLYRVELHVDGDMLGNLPVPAVLAEPGDGVA